MRGVLHQVAFFIAVVIAPILIVGAQAGTRTCRRRSLCGVSGRVLWSQRALPPRDVEAAARVSGHAASIMPASTSCIAGTYTSALLVLQGAWCPVVLTIVWAGAIAATLLKFVWVDAPKWLAAAIGIALGWVAIVVLPQMIEHLHPGWRCTCSSSVASRYSRAMSRTPLPGAVSGVRITQLFHALTIVGVSCQYVAIAFFVVRAG